MSGPPEHGDFPLRSLLDMALEITGEGSCVATIAADDRHMNPNGVVHGAVLFALLDTAMGGATMSVLDGGRVCATVDLQLRFLRPAVAGTLDGTARVLKTGRHLVHLEGEVVGHDGRPVATAQGTFAILDVGPS